MQTLWGKQRFFNICMLKMREQRYREVKWLAQDYTPIQSWVSLWAKWLETMALTTILYCLWLLHLTPTPRLDEESPSLIDVCNYPSTLLKAALTTLYQNDLLYASVFLLGSEILWGPRTASYSYFYLFCLIIASIYLSNISWAWLMALCYAVSLFLPFTWCPRW